MDEPTIKQVREELAAAGIDCRPAIRRVLVALRKRRIEEAAEDLLKACESLLAVYAPNYYPAEVTDAFSAAVIHAREAIFKARGE